LKRKYTKGNSFGKSFFTMESKLNHLSNTETIEIDISHKIFWQIINNVLELCLKKINVNCIWKSLTLIFVIYLAHKIIII
jgi:hypothetical protein